MDEMNNVITATEFKNNLGKYIEYAIDNHQVIITKNGQAAVKLLPYITEMDQYWTIKEEAAVYHFGTDLLSYEEFLNIAKDTDQRLEFLNGELIVMDAPSKNHQEISGNFYVAFRQYLKGNPCKVYYAPFDVTLKKYDVKNKKWMKTPDVLQPDLLIDCDDDEKTNEKGKYMGVPKLVIEILSPGTRSRDMITKLNTYMISEVEEAWIVDPDKHQVLQYIFEAFGTKAYNVYREEEVIISPVFEGLSIALKDIFEV